MEVDENGLAGVTRLEGVGLDRAIGAAGDDLLDAREIFRRRGLVHQRADIFPDHAAAAPQHVQGDEGGERRIEPFDPGHDDQSDARQHAQRRHHVGHQMLAVGLQRRRPLRAALPDQNPAPERVEQGRGRADREAERGRLDRMGGQESLIGLAQDRERGEDDEHADRHGRNIFGLVVAVGMLLVGRARGDPNRDDRRQGRGDVDDAFERVRIERHAARQQKSRIFHGQHDKAHGETAEGDLVETHDREFHGVEFHGVSCAWTLAARASWAAPRRGGSRAAF